MTVGEIGNHFDMALPSISKHLSILKDAGFVTERKRGQYVLYALLPDAIADLLYAFLAPYCSQAQQIADERKSLARKRR